MELRTNVNAIIINDENKILLIKLKKGHFKGKICIPGGGINPGETVAEAIKREILEETGIELGGQISYYGICELINKKIASHRIVILMYAKGKGSPIESDEGISRWTTFEELKEIENELIPFAKEAINIWKNNQNYFKIITE